MQLRRSKIEENVEAPRVEGEASAAPALPDSHPVGGLQRIIEERLRAPKDAELPPIELPRADETVVKRPAFVNGRIPARFIKILAGLVLVAIFGWIPLRAILQTSSVEAIVNSRVVTLRAPIQGEVVATADGLAGAGVIGAGEPLLRIVNVRADRARLDSLRDRLGAAEIERLALQAKIEAGEAAHAALVHDVELFTQGRIAQLEARTAALTSDIAVARERSEEATAAVDRASTLATSGTVSSVELQRLTRAETIARQTEIGAEQELQAASVELEAARAGTFIGDSYNDRPSSAQRRDELRQRLGDLRADLGAVEASIARLTTEVAAETERYRSFSDVAVSLPVSGRVWEVMTAPGEQVQAGQDLLKILDCSGAVVTANVTESVYNRLSVGSPARFLPTDGGDELAGTVMNLTGLADTPANLAIGPSALEAEPYRVTVEVPGLASGSSCAVGRTGRVIFDQAP